MKRKNKTILREIEEKAKKNERHFRNNDGTKKCVITNTSMNFYDEKEKKWKPIDNSLVEKEDCFEGKMGKFNSKISKKDKQFVVYSDDASVSWKFIGENGKKLSSVKANSKKNVRDDISVASEVTYENVVDGVDIQYIMSGNNVKENIIIKERLDEYKFNFEFELNGFEMKLSEDNSSIELYSKKTGKLEFTIPSPFMYDANGKESTDVYYEIESKTEGKYILSVVASHEWMNNLEREFPIIIDPQLITDDANIFSGTIVQTIKECTDSENVEVIEEPLVNYIKVSKTDTKNVETILVIDKSKIGVEPSNIFDAKLWLCANKTFSSNLLMVNEKNIDYSGTEIEISIIEELKSDSQHASVNFKCSRNSEELLFYLTGDYAPVLILTYLEDINKVLTLKKFPLVGEAQVLVDMVSGETTPVVKDVTDEVMGIDVFHVFKASDSDFGCGNDIRLNLHEKLSKTGSTILGINHAYTDAIGMKHFFEERFWYTNENGEKQYIKKELVSVTLDGSLKYTYTDSTGLNRTCFVQREEVSADGLVATTKLEEVKKIAYFEQRIDEQKQLEEKINAYVKAIADFKVVSSSGSDVSSIQEYNIKTYFETFINASGYLLSKAEIASLKSLILQRDILTHNKAYLDTSNNGLTCQNNSISHSLEMDASDRSNILGNKNPTTIENTFERVNLQNMIKRIDYNTTDYQNTKSNILSQQSNISIQKADIDKQISEINSQTNALLSKNSAYRKQIEEYYKEYLNLSNELEKLKLQIPVRYLVSEEYIKGFNEKGNLVLIYDKHDNYVFVGYSKYYSGTAEKERITAVYNKDERAIQLFYDESNKLIEIIDALGKSIKYEYAGDELVSIIKSTGDKYEISRTDEMFSVSLNGNMNSYITYGDLDRVSVIETKTSIDEISHDNIISGEEKTISKISFDFRAKELIVTNHDATKSIFVFDYDDTENLIAYYEERDGKIIRAEKYSYEAFGHKDVQCAKQSSLDKESYVNFEFVTGSSVDVTLNEYNKVVKEVSTTDEICIGNGTDTISKQSVKEYTYNEQGKTSEITTVYKVIEYSVVSELYSMIEAFEYNNFGDVLRKRTYVEGEELVNGIDVEEYVYDEKGYLLKTISYNTMSPASKLYSEKEISAQGQTIGEFDALGKNKISYEYFAGTNSVCSKITPNGSKFSYGFDEMSGNSEITMSTEDGEENSIQRLYTNGFLTKVVSGDTCYEYTYDYKGRKTAISINGEPHITYSYEDKVEDTEFEGKLLNKVVARYANGNTVESISTIFGEPLKTIETSGTLVKTITYSHNDDFTQSTIMETAQTGSTSKTCTYTTDGKIKQYFRIVKDSNGADIENWVETYSYNDDGALSTKQINSENLTIPYLYEFSTDSEKKLKKISTGAMSNIVIEPKTDCLGRNKGKTISLSNQKLLSEDITYLKHGDHATNIPLKITYGRKTSNGFVVRDNIKYKYDENGNIHEVYENGEFVAEYKYDCIGRLVRENNKKFGKTYVFTYDNCGNILTKTEYGFTLKPDDFVKESEGATTTYSYSNGKLMSRSVIDSEFVYDSIGNPTTYKGWSLTWGFGRKLMSFGSNTFDYDAEGKRIAKNDITFTYDADGKLIKQSNGVQFIYDGSTMIGLEYNGMTYFYQKDLFGNVIAILDSEGNIVVKYNYDAWGNHTVVASDGYTQITDVTSIGIVNPIRYRGYYYDRETGLYYLHSRYYDPVIGRFINIDDISYLDPETINGLNLYSYCLNNPVMYIDPTGNFPILALVLGITALVGLSLTVGGVASDNNTLTAIGLTMVAIPALISGIGALLSGATYLSVIGGVTTLAGVGTGLFASAEYQEAFTGNNWMLDAGMSEGWYNGLMLAVATIATSGTIVCGVLSSIGNAVKPNQMMNSFQNNPNRWKIVKELVEPSRGANKGGVSTYTNYINKWTGAKLGIHKILKGLKFIHGPHFHPWI